MTEMTPDEKRADEIVRTLVREIETAIDDEDALRSIAKRADRATLTDALAYMGEDDDHDTDDAAFAHVVSLLKLSRDGAQ